MFNPATPLSLPRPRDGQGGPRAGDVGESRASAGRRSSRRRSTKLAEARRRIDASGRDIWLEVDGGVKADNIEAIARAGADTFVAGSAIFGAKDRAGAMRALRESLKRATMPA